MQLCYQFSNLTTMPIFFIRLYFKHLTWHLFEYTSNHSDVSDDRFVVVFDHDAKSGSVVIPIGVKRVEMNSALSFSLSRYIFCTLV